MRLLDGPRIEPRKGPATALVVLLHGYGSDGNDLIALGETWRDVLPAAAFVAPHAPERLPQAGMGGFQWFPLTLRDPLEYGRGVRAAAPSLDHFLDAELARLRLGADRLALVGFSQGTMMALHVGVRRAVPPAAIVGYSGLLADPGTMAPARPDSPGILLVHGDRDEVVPAEALHAAREGLAVKGYAVAWHLRPDLGHGIDGDGLRYGGQFLAKSLAKFG